MSDSGAKKGLGASLAKGFGMAKQFTMQKMGKAQATTESVEFVHAVAQMKLSSAQLREILNRTQALVKAHKAATTQYQGFGASVARLLQSHEEKQVAVKEKSPRASVADSPLGHISSNFHPYSLHIIALRQKLISAYESLLITPLEDVLNNEIAASTKLLSKLDVDRLDFDAKNNKVISATEKGKSVESRDAHAADVARHVYDQTVQAIMEKTIQIEVKKNHIMTTNLLQLQQQEQEYYHSASSALSSQLSGASIASVAVPASNTSVEEDYASITSDNDDIR